MSDKNWDKISGDPFRRVREKNPLDSEEDKTTKLRPAVGEWTKAKVKTKTKAQAKTKAKTKAKAVYPPVYQQTSRYTRYIPSYQDTSRYNTSTTYYLKY